MNAERAAEVARAELGVGLDGQLPDLLRLLEDEAGLRVFIVPLPKDGIDGAYQLDRGDPFILLNQEKPPVRKRFTLAHEFGHHFLGHGAQLDSKIEFGDRRGTEVDANRFAASLLMPRRAVDAWFARHDDPAISLETVVRLAYGFNVSAYVVRYRLEAVNRLSTASVKKVLDDALQSRDHHGLARQLGLIWPQDSIQVEHGRGAYVPAVMQAKVADLVQRGLLTHEAASARLRLPGPVAVDRINELLTPELTAE